MAATTTEDLVQMLKYLGEQVTKMVEAQQNPYPRHGYFNWDNPEKYKNIAIFSGEQKDWEEFSQKLRSQLAAGSVKTVELMDTAALEMTEESVEDADWALMSDEQVDEDMVQEMSAKLYNVLMSVTTGEANAVVRRCRGNGFWAWRRLSTTLNPRTLASGVKAISQVLNPGKIANATKADSMIDAWEDKMVRLNLEYGEVISAKMKVAVLYAMLPKDLQEKVLDKCAVSWDGAKEKDATIIYGKVREEVKNVAKSRRDMATPKPMEVDKVCVDWGGSVEEEEEQDEGEINFVGKGSKGKGKGKGECWTCGEVGHRAAECPKGSGKGFSKGGFGGYGGFGGGGYGKGGPWGGYGKGDVKGGKGGWSVPMARACFGCGSTTHLLRDCPNRVTHKVQEVTAEGEPEVLFIGNIVMAEKEEQWRPVVNGRRHGGCRRGVPWVGRCRAFGLPGADGGRRRR